MDENQPKNAMPNQMVERQSFLGKLRKLRQAQELLSQPFHQVGREAESTDENSASSPVLLSPELYIIPVTPRYRTLEGTPQETSGSSKVLPVADNSVHNNLEGQSPHRLERSGPKNEGIPSELRERLLGKSPLRLVVSREPQFIPPATQPKYWIETLECSHVKTVYPDWYWDDGAHLVILAPSAKRRRCPPCRELEIAKSLPPKKPVQSVRQIIGADKAGEL